MTNHQIKAQIICSLITLIIHNLVETVKSCMIAQVLKTILNIHQIGSNNNLNKYKILSLNKINKTGYINRNHNKFKTISYTAQTM